ncbi:cell wall hydrolase [Sneathiella sp.]|uniref:cell wall hydrolase n=1 Tax=Sneathiella sp. TaxID=1964365 RepID=UPI002FE107E2
MYIKRLGLLAAMVTATSLFAMACFTPADAESDVAAADDPDLVCLAQAVYFEARGEPYSGQIAVAQVVHNRVLDRSKSYCEIVFEGSHRRNACQFSFACDGKSDEPTDMVSWDRALRIATLVKSGYMRDLSGNATFYHAHYVSPSWAEQLEKTVNIGNHIFYRKI